MGECQRSGSHPDALGANIQRLEHDLPTSSMPGIRTRQENSSMSLFVR